MKQKPFFSIITATYNSEKTLEKTILSILQQSFKEFEIIIIDGLSSDGTKKIIEKYKNKIAVLIEEKDSGIYDAMNKGINLATGQFLYFLNSDDELIDNNVLEDVFNLCEKNPKIDVLTANVIKVFPNFSTAKNNKLSVKNLQKGIMPPHQAMFVKKNVFDKIGGYQTHLVSSGDFEFCCKLVKSQIKNIYFDRNIAVFFAGGLSSQKKIAYAETYQIIKKYFGKINAFYFYFKKIIIEQNVKNLLNFLHFHKLVNFLTMLIMKSNKE